MKTTILYAHPWEGSYNHAILSQIEKKLEKAGIAYNLIDLNEDKFNPVLSREDLALYKNSQTTDVLVERYQKILIETNELVIISPIWWYELPAIVKGFFDKVMLESFAYENTKLGLRGLLTHIKKTSIITTSTAPKWYLKYFRGNYIEKHFIKGALKDIGIKNVKWIHFGNIDTSSEAERIKFLQSI